MDIGHDPSSTLPFNHTSDEASRGPSATKDVSDDVQKRGSQANIVRNSLSGFVNKVPRKKRKLCTCNKVGFFSTMVDRGTFFDINFTNDDNREDFSFVHHQVRSLAPWQQPRVLREEFEPNNWTVICGRGKVPYNHSEYFQKPACPKKVLFAFCTLTLSCYFAP